MFPSLCLLMFLEFFDNRLPDSFGDVAVLNNREMVNHFANFLID